MFTVYIEKEAFEEIVILNDQTPNWYKIFNNHADVCINITDADLQAELVQGTPIFEFILANGGRSPVALKDYFDLLYEDNSIIVEKPRAAFILNLTAQQSEQLRASYGILVQSANSIDDNALTGTFFKELIKDTIIENGTNLGWYHLLNFQRPPSNAVVICDPYLFSDTGLGEVNSVKLLDNLLPANLSIEYHVTLIAEDGGRDQNWKAQLTGRLTTAIRNLRNYVINIEIVFKESEHLHKRRLILNYVNASCDKGFCVFKQNDHKTVKWNNDLRFNRMFNIKELLGGDTDYDSATAGLKLIKKISFDLAQHINGGSAVYLGAIMGGHKADHTPRNRLINDV